MAYPRKRVQNPANRNSVGRSVSVGKYGRGAGFAYTLDVGEPQEAQTC